MKNICKNAKSSSVKQIIFSMFLLTIFLFLSQNQASGQDTVKSPAFSELQISKWKEMLNSNDINMKYKATWALGFVQEPSAVDGIKRMFQESRWELWQAAAWALGNIKTKEALQALIAQTLNSKYDSYIANALGEHNDTAAISSLLNMLKSSDKDGQGSAIQALGKKRNARAVEFILPFIEDRTIFTSMSYDSIWWDPDEKVVLSNCILTGMLIRQAALDALVMINDRRAIATLETELAQESDEKFKEKLTVAITILKASSVTKSQVKTKPAPKHK